MDRKFMLASLIVFVLLCQSVAHSLGTALANLRIVVQPEQSLVQVGDEMSLMIRLSPGVTAKLWPARQCGQPPADAFLVAKSGIYTIPIRIVDGEPNVYYCLRSSDNQMESVVLVHRTH